eukprot:9255280-Pyramimonas_sp.AAC.1
MSDDEMPESSSRYNLIVEAGLGFEWAQRALHDQRHGTSPAAAMPPSVSDAAQHLQPPAEIIDSDGDEQREQADPTDMDVGEGPNATTYKDIGDNLQAMLLVMQSWTTSGVDTTSKFMTTIIEGKFQLEMKATVLMTKADSMRSPEHCTTPHEALDEYAEITREYNELKDIFEGLREAKG